MKMDKNTFGDSQAAINLVAMIREHPDSFKLSRKIGRMFANINHQMQEIQKLEDAGLVDKLLTLVIEDLNRNGLPYLWHQDNMKWDSQWGLEYRIRTHIINVLCGRYKVWHRERK